jgi:hypothetical protein
MSRRPPDTPPATEFGRYRHLKVPAGVPKIETIELPIVDKLHDYKDYKCPRGGGEMSAECVFTRLAILYHLLNAGSVRGQRAPKDANSGWGNGLYGGLLQVFGGMTLDREGEPERGTTLKPEEYEGKYLGSRFWESMRLNHANHVIKQAITKLRSSSNKYKQLLSALAMADFDGTPLPIMVVSEVNKVWDEAMAYVKPR